MYILHLFLSTFFIDQTAKFSIRTLIQTFLQEFLNGTVKKTDKKITISRIK